MLGLGVLAGWMAVVAAAFAVAQRVVRTEDVRYLDMVAPWRWERVRQARASHRFAEARRCWRERKFGEGLMLARTGLNDVPAHREGRLLVAELLTGLGRTGAAQEVLLEGVRHHAADAGYLKPALAFLLRQQEDARVVALAQRLLPAIEPGADAARVLALAAATACYFRGNYDQADDFLRVAPKLPTAREGRLLSAKIEWDRGHRDLALLELRQLAAEQARDAEVHRELVGHLRRHGLMDEARRRSLAFQIAHPGLPGPRIELLFAYAEARDAGRVAREAGALMRDFAADGAALLALAEFAANQGDVSLARRLAQHAVARRLSPEAFALLAVEAMVVARDFREAAAAIREHRKKFPSSEPAVGGLLDSLQAVAQTGLGEAGEAELFLGRFLGTPNLRVENLLAVANRLIALDANGPARRALLRAIEVDPLNQAALTRLVEVEVVLNAGDELAAHVRRLIQMRRPSPDALRIAQHKLGSDLFLFSKECRAAAEAARVALARSDPSRRRP
ncbi:MAG: hypothetical protein HZA93_11515 [Verrucomicrobia bacterium]|nr:hypothetical protein [Verrucomicrobiota bacterium]